jgi:hypothetical protein
MYLATRSIDTTPYVRWVARGAVIRETMDG